MAWLTAWHAVWLFTACQLLPAQPSLPHGCIQPAQPSLPLSRPRPAGSWRPRPIAPLSASQAGGLSFFTTAAETTDDCSMPAAAGMSG